MIHIGAEKQFENKVKKFLEEQGCWFVKFFANAYTKKGVPDILCCCGGYFLGIEVKAPNGKPSELQKLNVYQINNINGFAVILYPDQFDNFKEMVRAIKCGNESVADRFLFKINERWDK